MKICLVTTFPPSTGGLSEYGLHIAEELQRNPLLSLTVLADELAAPQAEPPGYSVVRCWSFDDPGSPLRIIRAVRKLKPDVVWFNLLFSTFGRRPMVAFSGLMTPLLVRLSGRYTHVTLHHLMDTVDLKDAGIRHEWLFRSAGAVATRMLLLANSVSVLMPGYRKILKDKYGRDNVHLRSHGILARRPEFPDFSRRGNPHRILAFGKWGTYKRLELMIEAFRLLSDKMPDAKLVVAGGDHPQAHGYTESIRQQCEGDPKIEFCGYVPEENLPELFQRSSVAVMPYSSSTGCSGVAHLACAYGVPIICADLSDFRQMAQGEEIAIDFYPPGNAQGLADCLEALLKDQPRHQGMAAQNFFAALRMTMPNVVQKYLRQFELQQHTQALKYVSRIRRLPGWLPSKSFLLRLLTRNSMSWARRSAIINTSWNGRDDLQLLHGNGNGRGHLSSSGAPADSHGITSRAGDIVGNHGGPSSARGDSHNQHSQDGGSQELGDSLTSHDTHHRKTEHTHAEKGSREPSVNPAFIPIRSNGNGGDGKNGVGRTTAGNDGSGTEGAGQIAGQPVTGQSEGAVEGANLRSRRNRDIA